VSASTGASVSREVHGRALPRAKYLLLRLVL
jgi:hypothetical protein